MNQKYKYLIKNTGLLTISNFSSKVLVFLLVPLYTSVLSTREYGIYDLMISTITLLYPILTINIVDAVMRFCMDNSYDKNSVAKIGFRFISLSCISLGILLIPIHYIGFFRTIRGYEVYILLYYISYVFNQYFVQLAKGLEKVKLMAISGLCGTIVLLGGNIVFLLVLKLRLDGFFIANILSQFIPALILSMGMSFHKIIKSGKKSPLTQSDMISYCSPLIFTTIGWWVNSASDKYVVSFLCGVAANGVLSISYKIPSIVNTVFGMFGQAWQISAIKEYNRESSKKFYGDALLAVNMIMCCGCSMVIILSKPLASLLYGKEFYEAWQYAPFLLCSSVFNSASGMLGPILSAQKNSKAMAKSAIIGAAVNIVLNIILVWAFGVQGATIATVISAYVIYHIRKVAVGETIQIDGYFLMVITWILLIIESILEIYTTLWAVEMVIMLAIGGINYNIIKKMIAMLLRRK